MIRHLLDHRLHSIDRVLTIRQLSKSTPRTARLLRIRHVCNLLLINTSTSCLPPRMPNLHHRNRSQCLPPILLPHLYPSCFTPIITPLAYLHNDDILGAKAGQRITRLLVLLPQCLFFNLFIDLLRYLPL